MEGNVKRVLFVNSEMVPYTGDSSIAERTRCVAQGIQERKIEIRTFMPRYGIINERKNQLHEVIRLSGMNIVVDDVDRPLVIKVASLPSARMQVYFIDNDDFFRRKAIHSDASGHFFKDNGERAVFFARGVLETVKKLRWSPDVIHCTGWISYVLPLYLKKCYKDDPIFSDSKIVVSICDDILEADFGKGFPDAISFQGTSLEDVAILSPANGINLAKLAVTHSEGVILESPKIPEEITDYAKGQGISILDFIDGTSDTGYIDKYKKFYEDL